MRAMSSKEPVITLSAGPVAAYPRVLRAMSMDVRSWQRSLFLVVVGFLSACPGGEVSRPPEPPAPLSPDVRPVVAGKFEDCTPAGFSDVVCDKGLRCALVRVGEPPNAGYLAKCVPVSDKPLKLNEPCQFDQPGPTGSSSSIVFDGCGEGLGCVDGGCRKLCARGQHGDCGDALCVLPSQVSGTSYCGKPDSCQAVFPQTGCGVDGMGNQLGCYVLSDDKAGGTFCLFGGLTSWFSGLFNCFSYQKPTCSQPAPTPCQPAPTTCQPAPSTCYQPVRTC